MNTITSKVNGHPAVIILPVQAKQVVQKKAKIKPKRLSTRDIHRCIVLIEREQLTLEKFFEIGRKEALHDLENGRWRNNEEVRQMFVHLRFVTCFAEFSRRCPEANSGIYYGRHKHQTRKWQEDPLMFKLLRGYQFGRKEYAAKKAKEDQKK